MKRPISPHLQIYKPQITSVLSITHRLAGIVLGTGMLILIWWLLSIAIGPEMYKKTINIISSWFGLSVLLFLITAFCYHLLNGIRHLIWDTGRGIGMRAVNITGWLIILLSIAAPILIFVLGIK